MKKFIGDLSRQDAELLERHASTASSVLEFGVGGSTHIISQALPIDAHFLSLDTDPAWISRTKEILRRLGTKERCKLLRYEDWTPGAQRFDMIFDDGVDHLRLDFALSTFPLLSIGGALLLHDTRRIQDVRNVLRIAEAFFEEIDQVLLNARVEGVSSNITVIRKKAREPYVDWNAAERRPAWAVGHGEVPDDFWSL